MSKIIAMLAYQIWLILGLVLLILELFIPTLICLALGLGFISTSLFSYFNVSFLIQVMVFGLFELLFIVGFLPKIKKKLFKTNVEVSNVGRLLNLTAIVTKPIKGSIIAGEVKIEGEYWKATSTTEDEIPEQSLVKIIKVDSSIVIVEKIN